MCMKKCFRFGLLLFSAAVLACAVGCSDDKDDNNGGGTGGGSELPDPEGTGILSLAYTTTVYIAPNYPSTGGGTRFTEYPADIPDFSRVHLSVSGNLVGGGSTSDTNFSESQSNGMKFSTVGKVKGLSQIQKIPQTGWAEAVGALPGYGYVAEYNGIYCRLYVTDYLKDSEGNKIGAILKYQAPFTPEQ